MRGIENARFSVVKKILPPSEGMVLFLCVVVDVYGDYKSKFLIQSSMK